jgi:hypothetical protein
VGRSPAGRCLFSDQPTLRQRYADALAHDDVIEQANVHQCKSLLHPLRNQLVGLTRLGDAGWVLGFISRCHHHLFDWGKAVHFRTLRVAPASVRGE